MDKIGGREMFQHYVMNVVEASGTAFEVGKSSLGFRQGKWGIEEVRRFSESGSSLLKRSRKIAAFRLGS